MTDTQAASIALYVHFPWCAAKCPYCDFNSHPLRGELEASGYTAALLTDLQATLAAFDEQRPNQTSRPAPIGSVFFGGGTPSLFPADSFARLLEVLAPRLLPDAEVTMEANPGTTEHHDFRSYRQAGINRLSLGAQSFDDLALKRLGRIHGARDTRRAFDRAVAGGFERINLDLMYGLPEQSVAGARSDLNEALALEPEHLSWYQLTLEPRTEFHRKPPPLPGEATLAGMEAAGLEQLAGRGYERYEVSAYARSGGRSQHNLTYWTFGDYLGVGAGAHGKWLDRTGTTVRTHKARSPRLYLREPTALALSPVAVDALPAEFAMNVLRLTHGVPADQWQQRTGRSALELAQPWERLAELGLMHRDRFATTVRGYELLDSVVAEFLSDDSRS